MKELNLYSISGLYYEYYDLNYTKGNLKIGEKGSESLCNINAFFWKNIFSDENFKKIYKCLDQNKERIVEHKHIAALNNWEIFVKKVKEAIYISSFHDLDQKEFFSAIETLNIYCSLYSEYISYPFKLTLEDGFDVNEISTDFMMDIALNPTKNPYYDFINEFCKDIILEQNPDVIWFWGKIRLSTLAQAMLAKQNNPNVHICVVGHSSEYYSLNKITKYLSINKRLFSIINSIVLNDDKETCKKLMNALENKLDLGSVSNLMYVDTETKEIHQTGYSNSKLDTWDWINRRKKNNDSNQEIPACDLINMRIWPNSICFWNKCTFCGINKKYIDIGESVFGDINEKVEIINNLSNEGVVYYWFIDEAVPPAAIMEFSETLIKRNINIKWQIRSRIDFAYENINFETLYNSGLREIRLGLESGSSRVRTSMKKFSKEIDNNYVEKLVKKFNDAKISVHFPMIIGFPTETYAERQETYEFLSYLKIKYPLMTFNINILGLDISSELFLQSYKYGISQINWQCNPESYVGNLVSFEMWDKSYDYACLDAERERFMREVLYPWMPVDAITPVSIFYRLTETSRNTLVWKSVAEKTSEIQVDSCVKLVNELSFISTGERLVIYNMNSHHKIECAGDTIRLIEMLKNNDLSVEEVIKNAMTTTESKYDWTDYWREINTLYELGFVDKIFD